MSKNPGKSRSRQIVLYLLMVAATPLAIKAAAVAAPRTDSALGKIMALSEERLLAIVPDQSCVEAACPKCRTYLRSVRKGWKWTMDEPFRIQCPLCETVYPDDACPMDHKKTFLNFRGEEITVPYHLGPRPEGEYRGNGHPEHYYFAGAIDSRRFAWLKRTAIPKLVKAFKETGKQEYARRIAILLDRLAANYKHYVVQEGRGINNYYVSTGGPFMKDGRKRSGPLPYTWTNGRFETCWISEIQMAFVEAYSLIKDTAAIRQLSAELGRDVNRHIEDDLIREMVDFVLLVPWQYHMENNLSGYMGSIAEAGKAINEPEYVHITYRYLKEFTDYGRNKVGVGYTFDYHHAEGPQAHFGLNSRVGQIFRAIEGYSDPAGYRGKTDGLHLERVSARDFGYMEKMQKVVEEYALPNGQMNPLSDSLARQVCEPLSQSSCKLLGGYGHAVLGAGKGSRQVQIQMTFSEQSANHTHRDCLGLVWFAHGREMSGDIGYQRNKLRSWSAHALSHNTVVVDKSNQSGGDTFGNVLMYAPGADGLSAIQVDGTKAYIYNGVSLYRRTVVVNTIDIERPYFVDIFEVRGGGIHDYAIHGSVFGDMSGACSLAMKRMEGNRPLLEEDEKWIEPGGTNQMFSFPSSLYGLFENVSQAPARNDFHVTMAYGDKPNVGTRIHMPGDDRMQVFLAQTPALRKAGHYKDNLVYQWKMPHLLARRKGPDGLKSTFIAVYELFADGPAIVSVTRLTQPDQSIALEIRWADRKDTLLYAPNDPQTIQAQDIKMQGKLAIVSQNEDAEIGYLIGGTTLKTKRLNLTADGVYKGTIESAMRKADGDKHNAFIVRGTLPTGTALRGSWIIVRHGTEGPIRADTKANRKILQHEVTHAYEIDRIDTVVGKTIVCLTGEHGLKIEGNSTREIYSQWKVFTGANRYTILSRGKSLWRK